LYIKLYHTIQKSQVEKLSLSAIHNALKEFGGVTVRAVRNIAGRLSRFSRHNPVGFRFPLETGASVAKIGPYPGFAIIGFRYTRGEFRRGNLIQALPGNRPHDIPGGVAFGLIPVANATLLD
jgi:hypothetical protein